MKRHAEIVGRLSGSVQMLLLFPILLSGCAMPPQISTNQISREHKERIRAISVVPPLNPKQLEIVDANSGLGAKVTGSILGGLIGGLVVGIGESSEAKAASEMTRKFAERSSDVPFDPAQFLGRAIEDRIRKAGYHVDSIDLTNRNSRTFLSQKDYRNLRFVGDAVLECRIQRCGYLKDVPDKAFWPFVDIDLRITSIDGKQVLFSRKLLNVDLKWGGELWMPPRVVHPQTDPQFQDLEQIILNRQAVVEAVKQTCLRIANQVGECLTLHSSTLFVFRRGVHQFGGPSTQDLILGLEIDGRDVDPLVENSVFHTTLPPGKHIIRAHGAAGSNIEKALEIDFEAGQSYYVNAELVGTAGFVRTKVTGVDLKLVPEADGRMAVEKMRTPTGTKAKIGANR